MPVQTGKLVEELHLVVAEMVRVLSSLSKVEGQSEKLLLVRGVKAQLFDFSLVFSEAVLELFLALLVRAEAWDVLRVNSVNKLLEFVWVAVGSFKVGRGAVGDILETVDLTKLPENRVGVLALALDTEDLAEVGLLGDRLDHMVEKLGLG